MDRRQTPPPFRGQRQSNVGTSDAGDACRRLADAVGLTSSPDAPREKTMVFVNTAAAADEIAREFNVLNLSAAAFHADMPSHDRAMRLKDFADGAPTPWCAPTAPREASTFRASRTSFRLNSPETPSITSTESVAPRARARPVASPTFVFPEPDLAAVRDANSGESIESAFSRKRSFRKKQKKYGDSRRGVADLSRRKRRD